MFASITGARTERGTRMTSRVATLLLLTGGLLSIVCGSAQAQVGEWVKGRRLPSARAGLSAVVVDGTIYAIGGVPPARNGGLTAVGAYDIEGDYWRARADLLVGRGAFGATAVRGVILVAGGATMGRGGDAQVEMYDPATDRWSARAPMTRPPHGRKALALAVVKQRVYALGVAPGPKGALQAAAVESYDPVLDLWTARADMPTARTGPVAGVVNGKIYAIGGGDADGPIAAVEEYDPTADRWTKKRDMPTRRAFATSAVVNHLIYIIGGVEDVWEAASGTVEVYDPARDTWRRLVDLPNPRTFAAAVAHEGKIYLLGGQHMGGLAPILDSVLVYDTGFRGPFSVSPRDSLITTWSALKSE